MTVRLTMLNSMAGDIEIALDRHVEQGLEICDLKDKIFGKRLEELEDAEVERLARLLHHKGLSVHCLSTSLGDKDLGMGEVQWRTVNRIILGRVLAAAKVLNPAVVRVIAARDTSRVQGGPDNIGRVVADYPWMMAAYDEIIAEINAAGYPVAIENECKDCILTAPDDVIAFFARLRPDHDVKYTWDIQNMWQMGTPPDLTGLDTLRPVMGMVHLKGGKADGSGRLATASGLRDATWPVSEIVREAISRAEIDVICINPSHGERPAGMDTWEIARDDLAYLRECDDRIA